MRKVHITLTWKLRKAIGELDADIDSTDCVHLGDIKNGDAEYWSTINSETYCAVKDLLRNWVREWKQDPKFCYFYDEDYCIEAYIQEKDVKHAKRNRTRGVERVARARGQAGGVGEQHGDWTPRNELRRRGTKAQGHIALDGPKLGTGAVHDGRKERQI